MLKLGRSRTGWIVLAVTAAMSQLAPRQACAGNPDPAQQTEQAVARALNLSGSDPGGAFGLKVLRAPLPANARVHLLSMRQAPGIRRLLARMACDNASDCLPFYALVRESNAPSLAPSNSVEPGARIPIVKPPLRSGDRVEIFEELSGLRLHTPGVCLQPGAIGDRIRVRTLATHRVLLATVATPNLVTVGR